MTKLKYRKLSKHAKQSSSKKGIKKSASRELSKKKLRKKESRSDLKKKPKKYEEHEVDEPFNDEEQEVDAVVLKKVPSSNSDSDSEPEDVSFETGKNRALQMVQQIRNSVKSQKDSKRKERQKRQDDNIRQKKQRIQSLESQKLSAEFLDSLADSEPEERARAEPEEDEVAESSGHLIQLDPGQSEPAEEDVSKLLPDFIPVTDDGTERVVALDSTQQFFSLPEQAINFRQQLLYGGDIRRQSAITKKALKAKRLARLTN